MKFRKTILIVCEGNRSEPNYFAYLRDQVIDNSKGEVFVKILPLPKSDHIHTNYEQRKGGRKRTIKRGIAEVEDYNIEDEFKSQPVCYVRKCQIGSLEDGYDELWAVYDKDGHTKHQQAYLLAKDESKGFVNIGFSSISFEMWILLHFELSIKDFSKSLCRISKYETLDCGSHTIENDCSGNICVCGRIVENKYLNYNNSKHFDAKEFDSNYLTAIKNAIELRLKNVKNLNCFYDLNPFTSLDRLVFKLKNIDSIDYIWKYDDFIDDNLNFIFRKDNSKIYITISNHKKSTFILSENYIKILDVENKTLSGNSRQTIYPKDTINIEFDIEEYYAVAVFKNDIETFIIDKSCLKNIT
ncbi:MULTISPECIES: RloB family protein [unclassified Empedobacter]|uniref:RloB family protein n=1 Tax=unclassified Empedobacter TaxID=2643773 RepID=UPI0025BA6A1A|nr:MULTISPECIES: RloB family protein [unclassified Empedobacter]